MLEEEELEINQSGMQVGRIDTCTIQFDQVLESDCCIDFVFMCVPASREAQYAKKKTPLCKFEKQSYLRFNPLFHPCEHDTLFSQRNI
jgi:hypothetical protein